MALLGLFHPTYRGYKVITPLITGLWAHLVGYYISPADPIIETKRMVFSLKTMCFGGDMVYLPTNLP